MQSRILCSRSHTSRRWIHVSQSRSKFYRRLLVSIGENVIHICPITSSSGTLYNRPDTKVFPESVHKLRAQRTSLADHSAGHPVFVTQKRLYFIKSQGWKSIHISVSTKFKSLTSNVQPSKKPSGRPFSNFDELPGIAIRRDFHRNLQRINFRSRRCEARLDLQVS